jgi:hypothetical protein
VASRRATTTLSRRKRRRRHATVSQLLFLQNVGQHFCRKMLVSIFFHRNLGLTFLKNVGRHFYFQNVENICCNANVREEDKCLDGL